MLWRYHVNNPAVLRMRGFRAASLEAITSHPGVTCFTDTVLPCALKKLQMCAGSKPRCAVVFVMILTLGVSLGLPAEDVLEAVYDESEALPLEGAPSSSIVLLPVAARTPQPVKSGFPFQGGSLTRRCQGRAERRAWSPHPSSDSLTILDHSLRC